MELTLYADVLFLIDFSMDFISMYLTGRACHVRMSAARLALASISGALISVIETALSAPVVISTVTSILSAALMCIIAFGRARPTELLKRTSVLWAAALLLGGIMTAVASFGSYGTISPHKTHYYVFILPAAALAVFLFDSLERRYSRIYTEVTIELDGESVKLNGLIDSGNLLRDPFTGEAVMILSPSARCEHFVRHVTDIMTSYTSCSQKSDDYRHRIRLIPASTVSGSTLLTAIRPDAIFVGDKRCRALIAISGDIQVDSDSVECVVPLSLV